MKKVDVLVKTDEQKRIEERVSAQNALREQGAKFVEDFDWKNTYKIRVRKGCERKRDEKFENGNNEVPDDGLNKMRTAAESEYIDKKLTNLPNSNYRDLTAILGPEYRTQRREKQNTKALQTQIDFIKAARGTRLLNDVGEQITDGGRIALR